MAINDPIRIKEIIDLGCVADYAEEVTAIIMKIWAKDFTVGITEYPGDASTTQWDRNHIKIRIIRGRKDLYVIWDLIHEYGHILDGLPPKLNPVIRLAREEKAWALAAEELKSYPRLLFKRDGYETYKEMCLINYRKDAAAYLASGGSAY
jgi:hypothetical protein